MPRLIGQRDVPQPRDPEQCRNEQRFRSDTSRFDAQMGFESRSVRGLTGENLGAVLVSPLPTSCRHNGSQKRFIHLEGFGQMLRHMRRHDAGGQSRTEGLMPLAGVPIAETPNEVTTAQRERPCAVQDDAPDRVGVFSISSLNRDTSTRFVCIRNGDCSTR
jgi:hypothetical protein